MDEFLDQDQDQCTNFFSNVYCLVMCTLLEVRPYMYGNSSTWTVATRIIPACCLNCQSLIYPCRYLDCCIQFVKAGNNGKKLEEIIKVYWPTSSIFETCLTQRIEDGYSIGHLCASLIKQWKVFVYSSLHCYIECKGGRLKNKFCRSQI